MTGRAHDNSGYKIISVNTVGIEIYSRWFSLVYSVLMLHMWAKTSTKCAKVRNPFFAGFTGGTWQSPCDCWVLEAIGVHEHNDEKLWLLMCHVSLSFCLPFLFCFVFQTSKLNLTELFSKRILWTCYEWIWQAIWRRPPRLTFILASAWQV